MSEPTDLEKTAIRALYRGHLSEDDLVVLRGYVARVDADLNHWEETARSVVRLFDPLAKTDEFTVTPGQLHAVAQGVKAANKTLRERLAERGHTMECLTTYLDTFDPRCPTCNPKLPENEAAHPRCALCGGNRDTCGHFVGAGAL